jgi:uncharacterized protein (DUF1800 family)
MANYNPKYRREFLNKFWSNQTIIHPDQSSLLNPFNDLQKKLVKNLPPIEQEVLFLNRTSFGIRPKDYVRIKNIGIENYLEEQLDYESIDNSELEDILDFVFPLVDASLPELIEYIRAGDAIDEDRESDAAIQLISQTMMCQLYSKRQLFEVMTEFWTNHFNIDIGKGLDLIFKAYEDQNVIRPNALTSFRQLLHADAKSSTMLYYLDNYTNTKDGPNENYARELMELHTLGVDGGYTEMDVKEVARCFTGWSIGENDSDFFEFYNSIHDTGSKIVLGEVINNTSGIEDGKQVLDMLAYSSTTAGFIAKKLIRRFCSDTPDINLIRTVAKTYLTTEGDIKEMLRTIFHSNQFLNSVDSKFKRPVEFVTSVVRAVDAETAQSSVEEMFSPLNVLIDEYEDGGQIPFFWPHPTGYPDVAAYWSNISSILRRINLSNGVAFGDISYPKRDERNFYSDFIYYDLSSIVQDATTAEEIVMMIENTIIYRNMLEQDRVILVDFLLEDGNNISDQRIRAVIGIVLSSTYFQFR